MAPVADLGQRYLCNCSNFTQKRGDRRLVQELDALADRMVELGIQMAKDYSVMEVEISVPQTQKVLVANR